MVLDILMVDIAQNDITICEGDSLVLSANDGVNSNLSIGDSHEGGIVFYLDGNGGGLVASPHYFGGAPWGCPGTVISGADGADYGDGQQNTADILAGCNDSWFQALVVSTYEEEGYDDWYIPSKNELLLMHQTLGYGSGDNVLDFQPGANYWSSTEIDANNAWALRTFSNQSSWSQKSKNHLPGIKVVRTFTSNSNSQNYTYNWTPGGETNSFINVQPSATTTYTVYVNS